MFIVQLATPQGICYLRGTVWTFAGAIERASYYETAGQARDALEKAKKFMKAAHFKAAFIGEIE